MLELASSEAAGVPSKLENRAFGRTARSSTAKVAPTLVIVFDESSRAQVHRGVPIDSNGGIQWVETSIQ